MILGNTDEFAKCNGRYYDCKGLASFPLANMRDLDPQLAPDTLWIAAEAPACELPISGLAYVIFILLSPLYRRKAQ